LKALDVGVIGCGEIAETGHLPAYMRIPGVKVQAIADIDEHRLHRVSRRFSIDRCYLRYEELLQNESGIDAVSICLPTFLHKDAVIASLEAGKHVLCEKPLALNAEEGTQMIRSAKRHGLRLHVGFCLRFSKALRRLRRWVRSGSFGDPLEVKTTNVFWRKEDRKRWYFDRSKGGGALFDMGPHSVDTLRWMFGQANVRSAAFKDCETIPGLDIESSADLLFTNGLEGQLHVSWKNLPSKHHIEVRCVEGTLCADLLKSTLRVQSPRKILGRSENGVEILVEQTLPYLHDEIWHFASSILNDQDENSLATGNDGLRALRTITSAYEFRHI